MLTLRQAMVLAGRNLVDTLSPAHDGMPFWNVEIDREGRAACNMSWPSHNVGRWWDALLRLEAATGFAIPAEAEAAMLRHLESLFDNPLSVCGFLISQPQSHWKRVAGWVDDHSHRESLLALACLARYRGSRWALEQGRRVVAALDGYILEDGTWDYAAMAERAHRGGVEIDPAEAGKASGRELTGTESHGRLIEALLEFFEVSGCEGAMRLAARLAGFHYDNITRADGTVPAAGYLHTHSLFGTYRGLLLYGCMTKQHQYVERVAATYRETVRTSVKESGFISHDWTLDTRGETTSPGDAAQLALWLARLGYGEFLDDAERIVRARILPSQITERPGLTAMAEDGRDEHARLDERVLGAFGGIHRHPHGGILPTTDITAACLHTLCDVYRHVAEHTAAGTRINFHFDYEDERVRVTSRRREKGCLEVLLKETAPLFIRVPGWTPADSVAVMAGGQPARFDRTGCFLFAGEAKAGTAIQMQYDLPARTIRETTDGVEYRIEWRGDDVTGITPNTDFLPFYPTATAGEPAPGRKRR